MQSHPTIPLAQPESLDDAERLRRAHAFADELSIRRTVVGHPAEGCRVPDIERLPLDAYASFL